MTDDRIIIQAPSTLPLRRAALQDSWPNSIVICGAAGLVGSGIAAQLVANRYGGDVFLVDPRLDLLRAHVMDLRDLQAFLGSSHPALHVKDRLADAPVADLTILALAAAEQPSDDRRSYLSANLASLRRVAPEIARIASSAGTVLVLSNPVDVLATCLWRLTDIDPRRIVGYSLNDTVRFRGAVARVLGVDTVRVDAYVLGEHGGLQVPLLSAVRVDGDPVPLRDEQRKAVLNDITTWFKRWNRLKSGRSSAWMTPVGCLHLIEAMAGHGVVPASVWAGSELDLTQCYITLLARLGPGGLEHVESLSLDDDERAALIGAAVEVRRAASEALTQGE